MTIATLLVALEAISRDHPSRVLRLRGALPADREGGGDAFEVLIFRGFSSSVTHPTAADPDRSLLPEGSLIHGAELLVGPLQGMATPSLAGPRPVDWFLVGDHWR